MGRVRQQVARRGALVQSPQADRVWKGVLIIGQMTSVLNVGEGLSTETLVAVTFSCTWNQTAPSVLMQLQSTSIYPPSASTAQHT